MAAVRGPEAYPRIAPALERVGLAERADEKVGRYSLGMRQRLGVARCLLADPKLLILDEPTNGLDPHGIQEFRAMVRAIVQHEGRTVFLSSHLLDEVEQVCDHVAIVDHGRVIVQGSIEELAGARGSRRCIVGVDAPGLAITTLEELPAVREVLHEDGALRVRLDGRPDGVSELNAALVHAGVAVSRLEPTRHSLEERFLEITSTCSWRWLHESHHRTPDGRRRIPEAAQEAQHRHLVAAARGGISCRLLRLRSVEPARLSAARRRRSTASGTVWS